MCDFMQYMSPLFMCKYSFVVIELTKENFRPIKGETLASVFTRVSG